MTERSSAFFRKDRIEALADGIFATVMTILVLSLVVPTVTGANAPTILQADLEGLIPNVSAYIITFIFLGILWIAHQSSLTHIAIIDLKVLWVNILLLMGVALIPFSTALLGKYPLQPIAVIAYGINGLVVSSLYCVLFFYPRRQSLAHEEPSREIVRKRSKVVMVGPFIYSLAVIFAFTSIYISLALYVFVTIFYVIFAGRYVD